MKKTVSILLIICIVFSAMAAGFINSFADDNIIRIGDYSIDTSVNFTEEDDKEAQLYKYFGEDTVLDIPEYIGEYKITSIYYWVVQEKSNKTLNVEQINIPKTVIDVDEKTHNPFSLCVDCVAINVAVENEVYASENGILYSKDYTKLIRVPCAYQGDTFTVKSGVQTIGQGALANCEFSEIIFPETLKNIEQDFIQYTPIRELYFPNSLQSISAAAFREQTLTNVYFGDNVKIEDGFFLYNSIKEFFVSGNNPYLTVQDGVLFNKDKTKLICYPKGKSGDTYVIPDGVKEIAHKAFYATKLKTLNTNQVESIGQYCIDTTKIENYIFGEQLKSIVIGSSLFGQYTQSWTFLSRDCDVSATAYSAQKRTVYGYYGSTAHNLFGLNDKYKEIIDFVLLDEEPEIGFKYTDLTNDTVRLDSYIGYDTELEIPAYVEGKRVVEIGSYAFKDNNSITTLTVPSTITRLSSFALSGMSALTKIYINSFDCVIEDNALPSARVFACSGSTAESYANNHNMSFVSVGHQFVSEAIENEKLKKTCTVCGYMEIVDNPNPEHEYEQQVIAPTCTEQGYTINTCEVCGRSYTSDYKAALGHEPFELKSTSPTCKVEGKTSGIQCARCQLILKVQEPIAKLEHEYDGGNITTQPTCTEEGVRTFKCRNCDEFYTQSVEKIPHNYIKRVKASTCTEQGYTTYTCSYCNDTYQSDITPILPHAPKEIPAVPATCTSEGSTKGSVCEKCGFVIKAPQSVNKTSHQYNSGIITVSPTCQREGTKRFTCKNCKAYYDCKLAKINHIYINVVKKPASFSRNGVVNNECSMCKLLRTSTVVKSIKSVRLSVTVLTYTGKNLVAPKVIVKDSAGKVISADKYTVTYISRANSKAVSNVSAIGQYKVKITFKNAYSGSRYLYFTVKPRVIVNYAPVSEKKAITARWKRDASIGGYQVVISTDKAFTSGKRVFNINNNSITSKKITGLKSGTRCYVKVRSYKRIIVDGKKLNIYSSYSAVKAVKSK